MSERRTSKFGSPYPANWSTTPGFYEGIPNEIYHADREAVSKSQLDHLDRSAAHFRYALDQGSKETPALVVGRALHVASLEPELFDAAFVVKPEFRGTGAKARREAWHEEHAHMSILSEGDMATVNATADAIRRHPFMRWMFAGDPLIETTFVYQDDEASHNRILEELGGGKQGGENWSKAPPEPSGVFVRSRIDICREASDGRFVYVDIKSATDAREFPFSKHVHDYRYHVQGAIQQDAGHLNDRPARDFVLLVVEKTPPYVVTPYRVDEASIDLGRVAYLQQLEELARRRREDDWPGYVKDGPSIRDISVPGWAFNQ